MSSRGTIFVEDARIVDIQRYEGEQAVIRLHAPECASRATAGSFVHLSCDAQIPMRRPISIMRCDQDAGWIDILYKTIGEGLAALSRQELGTQLSLMGPIGKGFTPDPARPRSLLIGGGVGIPPMVFLAEALRENASTDTLVLMGSELEFPFSLSNSSKTIAGIDPSVNASMSDLETLGIDSRLATLAGFDGCYEGYVTQLADACLSALGTEELSQTCLYACGPTVMLEATAKLAAKFGLPAQVSLEEFMACAVGGCAGCAVEVATANGPAMKRVCVDGPVFAAAEVFPAN
ncbi:MAG: dihydroorotate dehydrogenase electron transfer subunit [Pseudomonadota bacterium]